MKPRTLEIGVSGASILALLAICWLLMRGKPTSPPQPSPQPPPDVLLNLGNIGHTPESHLLVLRLLSVELEAHPKAKRVGVTWSGILQPQGEPFTEKLGYDREKQWATFHFMPACGISEKDFRKVLKGILKIKNTKNVNVMGKLRDTMGCA